MGEIIEHDGAQLPSRAQGTTALVARNAQLMKMMELALANENGISQLEKLMELQQKWDAEQARKEYFDSLAAFQSDLPPIPKRKSASFTNSKGYTTSYNYASLDDITEAIKPFLVKHGFSYRFEQKHDGTSIWVTCVLTHAAGHSERCMMSGFADASGSKNAIQAQASTVTYLRRYTLTGTTGVACIDDDIDGELPEPQPQRIQQPQYQHAQQQAQQVQYYPQDKFEKNLPQWQQLIESGAKTAAAVIATVESRQPMTAEQKNTINAINKK